MIKLWWFANHINTGGKVYEVLKSDVEYTRDKTVQYIKAKNMILEYLQTNDQITSAKIQEMCGFTKQQARSVIDKMRSDKLITLSGKGPAAKYVMFDGLSGNWVFCKIKLNRKLNLYKKQAWKSTETRHMIEFNFWKTQLKLVTVLKIMLRLRWVQNGYIRKNTVNNTNKIVSKWYGKLWGILMYIRIIEPWKEFE